MNETEGLVSLIRQKSSPLIPVKAELSPAWEALIPGAGSAASSGIRAFIFDLYGTLFVSGAGEIGAANEAFGGPNPAVLNPAVLNPPWPNPAAPEAQALRDPALLSMKRYFHGEVTAFHKKAKAAGRAFPEVRVEEIWAGYDGPVPESWGKALSVRERAVLYELAVNPVYPMPGAAETIGKLKDSGVVLGIISNAQFFSPLLFNAFFGKDPAEMGFDPRLLIWSFEEAEAKPSARLFEKALARLKVLGIKADEAVYTGNDIKNDIIPAAAAGFKTVLFAGDRRSLRLRDMDPLRTKTISGEQTVPSFVIRDLQSLPEIR